MSDVDENYVYPSGPGFVMPDYSLETALASVGPGWAEIVEGLWRLCKAQDPPVTVSQVKEKYGTLRFYVHGAPMIIHDAIDGAERRSGRTCEVCGNRGVFRARGRWYMTRCEEDAEGSVVVSEKAR